MINNENILMASLFGSTYADKVPRIEAVENEINKHVFPPINLIPFGNQKDEIYTGDNYEEIELWMTDKAKSAEAQFFPLSFRSSNDDGQWWTLPWEPLISVDANIRMTERYVAKAGKNLIGSIKERWSPDDYSITITGAFYGQKMRGKPAEAYPRADMERLRNYLLTPEAIEVQCELLQIFNINKIAINSMSFPFTKGEYVQAYEIKAKSDFPWNLIYKRKKLITGMPVGEFIRE